MLKENSLKGQCTGKLPYNIRLKKATEAAYRKLINRDVSKCLKKEIYRIVVTGKKYRNPDFTAKDLADLLGTNTRYLSAVVNEEFGMNFSCLMNKYRIRDAKAILANRKYAKRNMNDVSAMVGFANRQSFYASFFRLVGITPSMYRKMQLKENETDDTNAD